MKIIAVLSALIAVRRSLPAFDDEAMQWCRSHNLVETVTIDDQPADVLTQVGTTYLTFVEAYSQQLLHENFKAGNLRRPNTNGKNEDHHANQQERHGSKGKAKQGKKAKDHGARYRRKCPF